MTRGSGRVIRLLACFQNDIDGSDVDYNTIREPYVPYHTYHRDSRGRILIVIASFSAAVVGWLRLGEERR